MKKNEDRWIYEKVPIELIDDAELNANKMIDSEFNTLTENIEVSGLSSVPCCYKKENGRFVIISGHHRIRACRKLLYKTIGILYALESDLTKDEIIAIQLSHNSVHGESDQNILKKMFEQIQNVDFKRFAHVDIDEIGTIDTESIAAIPLKENYTLSVILYGNSVDNFSELIGDIRELSRTSDTVLIAKNDGDEDSFIELSTLIQNEFNIKSTNVSFHKLLELAKNQLKKEQDDLDSQDN